MTETVTSSPIGSTSKGMSNKVPKPVSEPKQISNGHFHVWLKNKLWGIKTSISVKYHKKPALSHVPEVVSAYRFR